MSLRARSKGAVSPGSLHEALQRDTDATFPEPSCTYLSGVSNEGTLWIKKKNLTQDMGKYSHCPWSPMQTGGLHTVEWRLVPRAESADNLSSFLLTKLHH